MAKRAREETDSEYASERACNEHWQQTVTQHLEKLCSDEGNETARDWLAQKLLDAQQQGIRDGFRAMNDFMVARLNDHVTPVLVLKTGQEFADSVLRALTMETRGNQAERGGQRRQQAAVCVQGSVDILRVHRPTNAVDKRKELVQTTACGAYFFPPPEVAPRLRVTIRSKYSFLHLLENPQSLH